jgi:hypothetical protein
MIGTVLMNANTNTLLEHFEVCKCSELLPDGLYVHFTVLLDTTTGETWKLHGGQWEEMKTNSADNAEAVRLSEEINKLNALLDPIREERSELRAEVERLRVALAG